MTDCPRCGAGRHVTADGWVSCTAGHRFHLAACHDPDDGALTCVCGLDDTLLARTA